MLCSLGIRWIEEGVFRWGVVGERYRQLPLYFKSDHGLEIIIKGRKRDLVLKIYDGGFQIWGDRYLEVGSCDNSTFIAQS